MSGGSGGSVESGDGGSCPRIIKRSESSTVVDVKTEPRTPSPVCVSANGTPQTTKSLRPTADAGGSGGASGGSTGGSCSGGGGSANASGGGGGGGSNETEAKNKDGRHWRGIERERRQAFRDSDRRSTHRHDRRRRRRHDTPHRRTVRGVWRMDRRPHRSHGSSNITATRAYHSPFGADRVHRHATRRRHRRHREHEPPRRPAVPKPVEDADYDEEDPLDDSESTSPPRSLPMPNQTVPRRGFDKNPDSASATAGGNPAVPTPGNGTAGVTDPKSTRDPERRRTEERAPRPRRGQQHNGLLDRFAHHVPVLFRDTRLGFGGLGHYSCWRRLAFDERSSGDDAPRAPARRIPHPTPTPAPRGSRSATRRRWRSSATARGAASGGDAPTHEAQGARRHTLALGGAGEASEAGATRWGTPRAQTCRSRRPGDSPSAPATLKLVRTEDGREEETRCRHRNLLKRHARP